MLILNFDVYLDKLLKGPVVFIFFCCPASDVLNFIPLQVKLLKWWMGLFKIFKISVHPSLVLKGFAYHLDMIGYFFL